jgi:hypothetical protein
MHLMHQFKMAVHIVKDNIQAYIMNETIISNLASLIHIRLNKLYP